MCRLERGCGRWGLWRGTRVLFGCFAGCRFCGLCRGGCGKSQGEALFLDEKGRMGVK